MAEIDSPLPALASQNLSEEIIRPVLRVLVTEELVGNGRAARITEFKLGPPVAGERRLALGWADRRRYVNEEPGAHRIEGVVELA